MTSPKLTLYRGFPASQSFTWSPFVTKLELRLRLSSLPYTVAQGSPRSGPTGKIPYVDVAPLTSASTPQFLGDSALITHTLTREGHISELNENLSVRDAAFDAGLRALCEHNIYFLSQRERWIEHYYEQREGVLASIPWPLRNVVGLLAYRNVVAGLHAQGTGRYSYAQYDALRKEAWATLAAALVEARRGVPAGRPFWALGGENATEADCTLFGFVTSALLATSGPETRAIVNGHEAVLEYARRIQAAYFPEYQAVA